MRLEGSCMSRPSEDWALPTRAGSTSRATQKAHAARSSSTSAPSGGFRFGPCLTVHLPLPDCPVSSVGPLARVFPLIFLPNHEASEGGKNCPLEDWFECDCDRVA